MIVMLNRNSCLLLALRPPASFRLLLLLLCRLTLTPRPCTHTSPSHLTLANSHLLAEWVRGWRGAAIVIYCDLQSSRVVRARWDGAPIVICTHVHALASGPASTGRSWTDGVRARVAAGSWAVLPL